jgi:predicted DNA-binding transcriptional regulator AlpA
MNSPYLSVKEVASFLNKSVKWVYLNQEKLPGYFKLAGAIFFDKDILLASLRAKATRKA